MLGCDDFGSSAQFAHVAESARQAHPVEILQ